MPEQELVLRTENLVKRYRNRTVVDHVSIELPPRRNCWTAGPKWCR